MKYIISFINKNTLIIFLLFIFLLSVLNYFFCKIYVSDGYNPWLVDQNGNYLVNMIAFKFGPYIESILSGKKYILKWFDLELAVSRRPLLPYTIVFLYKFFSKNFILIHLFKNIFFCSLIFLSIKTFYKNYNNLFLILCLILIFYIPHNLITNLGTENEEGILNYLIIILFFTLLSNHNYKSIFLTINLCLIFLLKGSMFLLACLIPLVFIFVERKKTKYLYLPLLGIILTNIFWGIHTKQTNGFFALGPKSSSMNAVNISLVANKYFNTTYPTVRPDIHLDLIEKKVKEKKILTENQFIDEMLKESNKYILSNLPSYIKGVMKKVYVLTLSPYKDGQYPIDENQFRSKLYKGELDVIDQINNPIRYSNIPNKLIFNLSLIFLFISFINFKNNSKTIRKLDIYYFFILLFYLAPYMFAWIYPRHATALYILSHLYILLILIEKKYLKINHIFKN